jgi:hypothetical protein
MGGNWDTTNAASLIRYTVSKGYTIHGWELGMSSLRKTKQKITTVTRNIQGLTVRPDFLTKKSAMKHESCFSQKLFI